MPIGLLSMHKLALAAGLALLVSTVGTLAQDAEYRIVTRGPSSADIVGADEFFSFYSTDLCKRTASGPDTFTYSCPLDSRTDSFEFRRDERSKQLVLLDLTIADDLDYEQSVDVLEGFFR